MNSLVDRYKIRAPLRCDGVGSLDCAEEVTSGKRMAIRWLPLEANGDVAAQALKKLPAHPSIPKIQETGQVGTAAYVAMDFPEGKLLATLLGPAMSAANLRRLGLELASGLNTIHADGTFHGELSADSILMLPDGQSILWDIPLVVANRLTDRRGEQRLMRHLMEISPYLSPERARGGAPDAASDIYSLGTLLCFAAGTELPVEKSTLHTVHRIATGQWSPEVPSWLPGDVRRLLYRMLSVQPAVRPSAREVLAFLTLGPSMAVALPKAPTSGPVAIPEPDDSEVVEEEPVPQVPAAAAPALEVVEPPPMVEPTVVAAMPVDIEEDTADTGPLADEPAGETTRVALPPEPQLVVHSARALPSPAVEVTVFSGPTVRPVRWVWALVAAFAALLVAGGVLAVVNFPRRPSPAAKAMAIPAAASEADVSPAAELSGAVDANSEDESLLEPLRPTSKRPHVVKRHAVTAAAHAHAAPPAGTAAGTAPAPKAAPSTNGEPSFVDPDLAHEDVLDPDPAPSAQRHPARQ